MSDTKEKAEKSYKVLTHPHPSDDSSTKRNTGRVRWGEPLCTVTDTVRLLVICLAPPRVSCASATVPDGRSCSLDSVVAPSCCAGWITPWSFSGLILLFSFFFLPGNRGLIPERLVSSVLLLPWVRVPSSCSQHVHQILTIINIEPSRCQGPTRSYRHYQHSTTNG